MNLGPTSLERIIVNLSQDETGMPGHGPLACRVELTTNKTHKKPDWTFFLFIIYPQ